VQQNICRNVLEFSCKILRYLIKLQILVKMVSLKENFDTETPQGKFILTIFAAMAGLEREATLQRQDAGYSCRQDRR